MAIPTEIYKTFDTDALLQMMLGFFLLLDSTVLCLYISHNRQRQASCACSTAGNNLHYPK